MANKLILRKQKSPYTGNFADTTKSKTLSISELDNNQIYLKGLNIITGSTSGTDIILDKLNGDQIIIDASSVSNEVNLGNTDLTLTENRTINLTGNSLTYSDSVGSTSVESSFSLSSGDTLTFSSPFGGAVYSKDDESISYTGGGIGGTFVFNVGRGTAQMDVTPSTGTVGGFTLGDDKIQTKGFVTHQTKGVVDDSKLSENNLYYLYVDSGELKGRHKDNLGVVTDLTIGSTSFGLIEVITDGDAGEPTYFTDLQTALETCKTSGSNNVVKLHSDISLSAQIDINYGGTGTGNGYNFNSLTIDFNGFEVSFDDAGTTDAFNISFINSSASNQKIIFLNGKVSRTSGTGTHYALKFPSNGRGDIIMSNMYWYCQNGGGAYILATTPSAKNITHNFGDSLFVSESATAALYIGISTASNFKARNTSSGAGLVDNGSNMLMNFEAYSNSGNAALIRAGDALNFYCYSNSGTALNLDNDSRTKRCSYFTAESNSGYAIVAQSNSDRLSHFNAYSNSSTYACWFVSAVEAQYGNILSNSGYGAFCISSVFKHCNFTSLSGTAGAYLRETNIFEHCNFEGKGGYGLDVKNFSGNQSSVLTHCNIKSSYNNAAGHAASFDLGGGNVYMKNCTFDVVNTSANCLYAASAQTVNIGNSGYGTATTPVNANVTEAITTAPNANGNYTI